MKCNSACVDLISMKVKCSAQCNTNIMGWQGFTEIRLVTWLTSVACNRVNLTSVVVGAAYGSKWGKGFS